MGTLNAITVPDAMEWTNEFSYRGVEQKTQYSITGAILIESAAIQLGRRIELKGGETYGWMPREDVQAICALANLAGEEMVLVFRGQIFTVVFDHEAGALESTPIVPYEDPDVADFYYMTLRFIVSAL